jgi:hypothetical protein
MHFTEKIRHYENLHIVFWLFKDSCWMLQLKIAGLIMVVPTVYLAIHIMYKTKGSADFFINAAILCWITANSYWMVVEFFFHDRHRYLSAIPFALGFLFVILYYTRLYKTSKANTSS